MFKKYNSITEIKNNYFNKKMLNKNFDSSSYFLWRLSVEWENIVNKIIFEKSEIYSYRDGKLYINVNDSNIHHVLTVCKKELINKINYHLQIEYVKNIEIRSINGKLKREKKKKNLMKLKLMK